MGEPRVTAAIRCRIAPSPTGPLHIGTARTALYNYLFARRHGGTFVLRLEDTDAARSTVAYEQDILDGLHWLGLDWDEGPEVGGLPARGPYGPYRQMERLPLYAAAAERLLAQDKAYYCYCTPEELAADRAAQEAAHQPPHYVGRCAHLTPDQRRHWEAQGRKPVIRFRVGEGVVAFDDLIRGHVEIDTSALGGDLVIVRSDGSPLYHFTVVVDDAAMAITHIIRGEDHLSNTPKHILLFRALGADVPAVRAPAAHPQSRPHQDEQTQEPDGDGATTSRQGYIREALVNYLALLGWASTGTEELFSLGRADRALRPGSRPPGRCGVRPGAPRVAQRPVDPAAVDGGSGRACAAVPGGRSGLERATGRVVREPTAEDLRALVPMIRERLPTLAAIGPMVDFLFVDDLVVEPGLLVPKRWDAATTLAGLTEARHTIAHVGEVSFEAEEIEPPLRTLAEARGWKAGDLFMAIRVAVTGRTATPPLFDTLVALGFERTLARLDAAREALAGA